MDTEPQQQGKPSGVHLAVYTAALVTGGMFDWHFGQAVGGAIVGVLCAIIGAIAASSLVGFIAMRFFGYKPEVPCHSP